MEAAVRYLDLAESLFGWLVAQSAAAGGAGAGAAYDDAVLSSKCSVVRCDACDAICCAVEAA